MPLRPEHIAFAGEVSARLVMGHHNGIAPFKNKTQYEKLAASFGIEDKTEAKELAEYATLLAAREIIKGLKGKGKSAKEQFESLVKLYDIQPGLTHRTSWSHIYQQYSTPIPIAFAAGIWAEADKLGCGGSGIPGDPRTICKSAFEPSAGNGLFTTAANPRNVIVNEIDKFRKSILEEQGFSSVSAQDASDVLFTLGKERLYQIVISNPPFDKLPIKKEFDGVEWGVLDHYMAVLALNTMAPDGRAAIIIGGHTEYDEKGRIKAGKNRQFISYLYSRYRVKDIINISGDLYRKQGTTFDIRLILIDGVRPKDEVEYPPLKPQGEKAVTSFEELWDRIHGSEIQTIKKTDTFVMKQKIKLKAKAALALKGIDKTTTIPEIEPVYKRSEMQQVKVSSSRDLYDVFRAFYNQNQLDLREVMLAAFLDRQMKVLGVMLISVGGKGATVVDTSFIVAMAAKTNASAVALSHNHPSGNLKPSEQDLRITKTVGQALKLIDVSLVDHLIVASNGYYSFTDEGHSLGTLKYPAIKTPPQLIEDYVFTPMDNLGGPYDPVAVSCFSLKVNVPDSMDTEVRKSQEMLRALGDVVEFVRKELNYSSREELCDSLAAEQIDAVAMGILKAKRGQAMIIGDQTGIGKGRQAAAMIRWVVENNRNYPGFVPPVFITEKPNLFSDLYRDLLAIGCADYKPFIVNNNVKIKDEEKTTIFSNNPEHQKKVWEYYMSYSGDDAPEGDSPLISLGYDFVVTTYSQFMQKKAVEKRTFLEKHVKVKGTLILDEAHNVSGVSDVGIWFQGIVSSCQAAIFLSATYAKRPDNMALYATKTSLKEIGASPEEFSSILVKGGTALQEVIASKLAENGEMVRRERPYEDVEVNYIILTEKSDEHRAKSDAITALIRDIIAFEDNYVMGKIEEIDKEIAASQAQTSKDNKSAGIGKTAMFSKIFQTIYQMLMAIKVDDVVDRAIERLQSGHKVVIAFGNTMESFLDDYETGNEVENDFAEVLVRALEGTLKYTEKGANPKDKVVKTIDLNDLGPAAIAEYRNILNKIKTVASGVTVSPIDVMIQRLEDAGYSVDEVTGRKRRVEFNERFTKGTIIPRKMRRKEDQFFDFQNNKTDVLLINQSGATGASAHAIPTKQVARERVKPRCMIVLQPELDINKEIQKRGRINRTGQIYAPKFDYIVSNIPAETRLLMMLKNKLKSLDANTSGSSEQNKKMLDYQDIMNKYGDEVITTYCFENEPFTRLIGDPLGLFEKRETEEDDGDDNSDETETTGDGNTVDGAAQKVTGRVAITPTSVQEQFYNSVFSKYQALVANLKESGDYDLDVETMPLEAKTLEKDIFIVGSGSGGPFSGHSWIEKVEINNLSKPLSKVEVEGRMADLMGSILGGHSDPMQYSAALVDAMALFLNGRLERTKEALLDRLNNKKQDINSDPKWADMDPAEAKEKKEKKLTDLYNQYEQAVTREEDKNLGQVEELRRIFRWFVPGKSMELVTEQGQTGTIINKAVFLGFKIDFNNTNPYAQSNINMVFAGLDGFRTRTYTLSRDKDLINATIAASMYKSVDYLTYWDDLRKESSKSRITAQIITGNVIAALTHSKVNNGRFIRFTTDTGIVRTGFMLKKMWDSEKDAFVRVPVFMAKKYLLHQATAGVGLSKNITFSVRWGDYYLSVPRSQSEGGEVFKNQDLLIEARSQFEASGQFMTMVVKPERLDAVLKYLQDAMFVTVEVPRQWMTNIEDEIPDDLPEMAAMLKAANIAPAPKTEPEPETRPSKGKVQILQLKLKLKAKAALALKSA